MPWLTALSDTFIALTSQFPSFMLSQLSVTTETITEQVDVNPSHLKVPNSGLRPRKNSNSSYATSSTASSDASSLMDRLSLVSSATSIESSTSWGSTVCGDSALDAADPEKEDLSMTDIAHRSKRQLFLQEMFVTRRSCHYGCHCQCHEEPAAKPRRSFRGSRGGSKNNKPTCTDAACMGNETLEIATEEYSNSFRKVLSNMMSAKSVEVRYDLGTFRMVPEGSDPMRYVKHGNLEKLKGCVESGEATRWDTAPDGWSLLHVSHSPPRGAHLMRMLTLPLQAAAYNRQYEIVKYLLELGVATHTGEIGTRFVLETPRCRFA